MTDVDYYVSKDDLVKCIPRGGILFIITGITRPGKHLAAGKGKVNLTSSSTHLHSIVSGGQVYAHEHHNWDGEGVITTEVGETAVYRSIFNDGTYRVIMLMESHMLALPRSYRWLTYFVARTRGDNWDMYHYEPKRVGREPIIKYGDYEFSRTYDKYHVVGTNQLLDANIIECIAYRNRDPDCKVVTQLVVAKLTQENVPLCLTELYVHCVMARAIDIGVDIVRYEKFDFTRINYGDTYEAELDFDPEDGKVKIRDVVYEPFSPATRGNITKNSAPRGRDSGTYDEKCNCVDTKSRDEAAPPAYDEISEDASLLSPVPKRNGNRRKRDKNGIREVVREVPVEDKESNVVAPPRPKPRGSRKEFRGDRKLHEKRGNGGGSKEHLTEASGLRDTVRPVRKQPRTRDKGKVVVSERTHDGRETRKDTGGPSQP
jgi:hypothetical protein